MSVIFWTIAAGCVIFGLGLISAFAPRKKGRTVRANFSYTVIAETTRASQASQAPMRSATAMSMAANGTGNISAGEGEFASISGSSR